MHKARKLFLIITVGFCTATVAWAGSIKWGVNGHPLNQVGYMSTDLAEQFNRVSSLGAGWYRVDVRGPASDRLYAKLDAVLAEATKHHISLLPVLFSTPGARTAGATPDQIHAAAFEFGRAIATRYKGTITHWELQNELDIFSLVHQGEKGRAGAVWTSSGRPDGTSPDEYADDRYKKAKAEISGLLEGVKAAEPGAVTMVDGTWLRFGFIHRLLREDHVNFDALAWHWYSGSGDIFGARGKINVIRELKKFDKPIWITEINYSNGSMNGHFTEQAKYLKDTLSSLAAGGDVAALFVYELLDEPYLGKDNGESYFGIVELGQDAAGRWHIGSNKPAFDAIHGVISRYP